MIQKNKIGLPAKIDSHHSSCCFNQRKSAPISTSLSISRQTPTQKVPKEKSHQLLQENLPALLVQKPHPLVRVVAVLPVEEMRSVKRSF